MSEKMLVAFDFDHTIIDDNSDLYVRKLAPNGKIPDHIKALYSDDGWTDYMGSIFQYLHENGTTPEDILQCMTEIKFTEGMKDLLRYLNRDNFHVIIISDSNSVFISHIMQKAGLNGVIDETYTNPAQFSDSGCLKLDYYHLQDWCSLSTKNLCKGHILEDHIRRQASQGVHYKTVAYVGDGSNDLCPGLKLRAEDLLFPRIGFSLCKKLKGHSRELKAQVLPWKTGGEILDVLKQRQ